MASTQNEYMIRRILFILLLTGVLGSVQAQKGELSIGAGPLLSYPLGIESPFDSDLNPTLGLEGIGQYNFSVKSALLLKATLASWGYKKRLRSFYENNRLTLLSFQGGYRYQFGTSGFFINGLAGVDIDLKDNFTSGDFSLGGGKRFSMKEDRFIDAGIDLIGADAQARVNIRVIFSLFRKLAEN